MKHCHLCGSDDLIDYETRPEHGKGGKGRCELACRQRGLFCRRCRYFRATEAIQCRSIDPTLPGPTPEEPYWMRKRA